MTTFQTPDGLVRLRQRIANARLQYKIVCDDNPAAAEAGDSSVWHDNFAYEENQRKMHMLARLVRDLEHRFATTTVIVPEPGTPTRVRVGTRVTYQFTDDDAERFCLLAGFDDGDPDVGRVSYNSPLGSALIGAEVGDRRFFAVAGRQREVEVLEIETAAAESATAEAEGVTP
jgi:transcription elongation GreA/GreB family factor